MPSKVVTLTQNGTGGLCTVMQLSEMGCIPLYEMRYDESPFPFYGNKQLDEHVVVTQRKLIGYMFKDHHKGTVPLDSIWDSNYTGTPEGYVLPAHPNSRTTSFIKGYYSEGRFDHAAVVTPASEQDILLPLGDTKHQYCFTGYLASIEIYQVPGTIPLVRMWHGENTDTKLVKEPNVEDAMKNKYVKVRVEGYVYHQPIANTVPLISFWHPQRKDSAVAAAEDDKAALLKAGYIERDEQGYVYL